MDQKIRVLVVDDHAVLRAGLRMLINAERDMEVIGEASDGREASDRVSALHPDVIILDITMPHTSGLDLLKQLQELSPASKLLILTMHNDESYLLEALAKGAAGYVLKQAADIELLAAIRVVYQGGTYLHREHTSLLLEGLRDHHEDKSAGENYFDRLSSRELEVLRLLAMGYTNKEAADRLYLSIKTVETYKARIMTKLGITTRVELVRIALDQGLMEQTGGG